MSKTIRQPLLAVFVGLVAILPGKAEAAFVTYTETVTGSGTLGTTAFTDASLIFTQTADTANVYYSTVNGFYAVLASTSTVNVAGVGTASFTGPTNTIDDPATTLGGLAEGSQFFSGSAILGLSSPLFANYDLKSSIGPITGNPFVNLGLNFATTSGNFALTSTTGLATFQAVVPEPSSLILCGVAALVGLGARARCLRPVV